MGTGPIERTSDQIPNIGDVSDIFVAFSAISGLLRR
jgi:hypothetical protein